MNMNIGSIMALVLKLFPKAIKLLKGLKFLGAAGSMAAYTWLFSWQFALVILVTLAIHESGHVWAMKKVGIKTKGFYFIPFIGGAAVQEESFKTRRQESFIALMGPVFGLVLTFITFMTGFIIGNDILIGVSAWMGLVNAFQFLPILPLDGGRVMRAIFMSISNKLGILCLLITITLGTIILIKFQLWLFIVLLPIGILELLTDNSFEKFNRWRFIKSNLKRIKKRGKLKGLPKMSIEEELYAKQRLKNEYENMYVKRPNIEKMTKNQIILDSLAASLVFMLLVFIMIQASYVPGAEAALQVMM